MKIIKSWGLNNKNNTKTLINDYFPKLKHNKNIPFGNGRSYGDSCLSNNHLILSNKFFDFDKKRGVISCSANYLLRDVIYKIVEHGWMFYVCSGTSLATLGGLIASDAHGKNHEKYGSFTNYIIELDLLLPTKKLIKCSRKKNKDLFYATCSGMGLTGIIMSCKIQLKKLNTTSINSQTYKFKNLKDVLNKFEKDKSEFKVAWINSSSLNEINQVIYESADFCKKEKKVYKKKITLYDLWFYPSFVLNNLSIYLFNMMRYFLTKTKKEKKHLFDLLFTLDKINNWNKFYPDGLLQFQFVIPKENAYRTITHVLNKIDKSKSTSTLIVLKKFGAKNENFLTFPEPGFTLALDFKYNYETKILVKHLYNYIIKKGGKIYLTKDCILSESQFKKSYNINSFCRIRKKYSLQDSINSNQSLRLNI